MEDVIKLDPFGEQYPKDCPPVEKWLLNDCPHKEYNLGECADDDCHKINGHRFKGVLKSFERLWLCPRCYKKRKAEIMEAIEFKTAYYNWSEDEVYTLQEYKDKLNNLMQKYKNY